MRIIRIDPNRPSARVVSMATAVLKRGGLVVYPTETAYALGCDAANYSAMRRIYAVKGRESNKSLPLICGSFAQAKRVAKFDKYSLILAEKFWPGPLTLILGKKALRVSSDPTAQALARALGRPIVSTSANRSGAATKYDVASVLADLGTLPDLVLDAGRLAKRRPSTIARSIVHGCEIVRTGPVSLQSILQTLRSCV